VPSRRHELLAYAVPRLRRARELADEQSEWQRVTRWHVHLDRSLPTGLVPRVDRRFCVVTEELAGPAGVFPSYVITPRHLEPTRTLVYLHGGGYMAPIDPWQVRYITRLATALHARVVMPDYPLAPEHTWSDSFAPLTALVARWAETPGGAVLTGDSAGGGYALALALAVRDRGGVQPSHLLLHAPWVDLSTSTPETEEFDAVDPWLFIRKLRLYAAWWAGSADELARPEVSPGLGDLRGLPAALMFHGTRDLLAPGCRLLVRRAAEAGWDLTSVEEEGLIHNYPLMPLLPEARAAFRRTVEFLR
jgi:monoterpene epsilon-lactone hydrolase